MGVAPWEWEVLVGSWNNMWALGSLVTSFLLLLAIWLNVPATVWFVYKQWKALRRIPGWPTHWLYGNLHQIRLNQESILAFRELVRKHGWKITRSWYGPFYAVVNIHHPDPLRTIMKQPKARDVYSILLPWLGEGLLIAEGDKWHRNRRLLTPAFHFSILKPYVSIYSDCVRTLIRKWEATAAKAEPVKLFDTVSLLSLDIILQCAFSYKSDCQHSVAQKKYVTAVKDLSILVSERFMNPLYRIDWLYWLTPHGRRMKRLCKLVHDHAEMVIKERKKALGLDKNHKINDTTAFLENLSKSRKLDFLDILLTAVDDGEVGLTDLEIRNEVDTFMFEGHDTTTSGMCWTLYCLAKHPEHQEKVREEGRSVLMGREQLEYDDLKELRYTQWCIKEAMRLYPPVTIIFRQLGDDLELEGHLLPKGTRCSVPIRTIHTNPVVWPNPDEYDPLRFHPSNAEGRDPYAYLPFSAGYRNCIGQNFALNEEKMVVASILNHFRLTLPEDQTVEWVPQVTLRAVCDIRVNIEQL